VKDLTNAKEKLEAQIHEKDETIETLRKRINGLVSVLLIFSLDFLQNFNLTMSVQFRMG